MLNALPLTTLLMVLVSCLVCPSDGARLLLIVDCISSRVRMYSRLGLELAHLGHDVRVLAPSNARVPDFVQRQQSGLLNDTSGHFNYTTYAVSGTKPFSDSVEYSNNIMATVTAKSNIQRVFLSISTLSKIVQQVHNDCQQLVNNQAIMDDLRNNNFQLVIIDPLASFFIVPEALGVPYASMTQNSFLASYRVPRLASFSPMNYTPFGDQMTFPQRLINLVIGVVSLLFQINQSRVNIPGKDTSMNAYDAFQKSSLWFIFEDEIIGYPGPQMPNTVAVGDLMIGQPGRPLPDDLESFVSGATNGIVLLSFGSYFHSMPDDLSSIFCQAFQRLPAGVRVIWKTGNSKSCSGVTHVKVLSWIPQNDLLADQRTRLFISHGGLNGLMETVYHAKPTIVFPLYGDQPYNAAAAEAKGFAVRMDIGDVTSDSLLKNIEEILSNGLYEHKAQRFSSILRDRVDTPAERVSHMINHVIKYGDSHLRTGAFELNYFQFLMFDLFAVIYSVILAVVAASYFVIRRLCYRCKRNRVKKAQTKKKKVPTATLR